MPCASLQASRATSHTLKYAVFYEISEVHLDTAKGKMHQCVGLQKLRKEVAVSEVYLMKIESIMVELQHVMQETRHVAD
jgi:hypothetical protein